MNLSTYDSECERLVADLLGYMTPLEKAGQLAVRPAPALEDRDALDRLVDDIRNGHAGIVHSVADREQADFLQRVAREETRLGIPLLFPGNPARGFATVMPGPLAIAASWDPDCVERAEAVVAQEALSRGFNWALSPEIELARPDAPLTTNSSSEDIHLAATIAIARIRGLQGAATGSEASLLACLDLAALLPRGDAAGSDPVPLLRLACAAISAGDVASISLGRFANGQRAEAQRLLRVLNAPGGFDGIMLSQWQDMAQALGEQSSDPASEGVDCHRLVDAIASGAMDTRILDDAVGRVLRVKFRHGLLRAALAGPALRSSKALPTPVHNRETALQLARRCPVLLRNDPALLPLGIDSGDILLVGPAASDRRLAMGEAPGIAASVIDGLEQLGIPHRYVPGLALRDSSSPAGQMIAADAMAIGMANEAAKRAGTVILVLANDETGGFSDAEQALLDAIANANPRLVVVNIGPRPVDPAPGGKPIASLLQAGQLGLMGGHAIAELIAGEFAPCGKLPLAIAASGKSAGLPLGHGLTYADFALTNLAIERSRDRLLASVDLRNVGEREGTEVVQLYVRRGGALQLSDFQRLALSPGQRETLVFELGRDELGCYRFDGSFHVETGPLQLFVGLSKERGMASEVEIDAELARAMAFSGLHPTVAAPSGTARRRAYPR